MQNSWNPQTRIFNYSDPRLAKRVGFYGVHNLEDAVLWTQEKTHKGRSGAMVQVVKGFSQGGRASADGAGRLRRASRIGCDRPSGDPRQVRPEDFIKHADWDDEAKVSAFPGYIIANP